MLWLLFALLTSAAALFPWASLFCVVYPLCATGSKLKLPALCSWHVAQLAQWDPASSILADCK